MNARILVVDDLEDWRETISGLLADQGYRVKTVDSSKAALTALALAPYDLAVIDVRLDETDEDNAEGIDLAAEIQKQWPDVKRVIVTGYATRARFRQAMEPDARGRRLVENCVEKKDTGMLVNIVNELLGRKG